MASNDRIRSHRDAAFAPWNEGYLVYLPEADRLSHLNPTAALLFELCDGTRTSGQIVDLVGGILGEAGRVAASSWIDESLRAGLVEIPRRDSDAPALGPGDWETRAEQLQARGLILAAYLCQSRAVQLEPGSIERLPRLAELAHILGRRDEARATYEALLAAHPDDAEVAHLLISLRDEAPPPRASDACLQAIYSRFASTYDSDMREGLEYQAPERLLDAVSRQLDEPGSLRILDLGCGTGLFGALVRPLAATLIGVDISPDMAALAKQRGIYDQIFIDELTRWLAQERLGSFDLLTSCDTLIYFGDLRQVLAPATRWLRSGGRIAFTVERGDIAPFALSDSGRFTHHRSHIEAVASELGLRVEILEEPLLRYEYGEEVIGLLAVLRAP